MALRIASGDDSSLNMTPMIDIVFQLILFFLFSLRFKALDHRIDALMPTGFGVESTPVLRDPFPTIRVAVRPADAAAGRAGTRVELAGRAWDLPPPRAHDESLEAERQRVKASVQDAIARLHADLGLPGQIDVAAPPGRTVPHADAVLVLDAFVGAEVTEVTFGGTRSPLPRR